MQPSMMKINCIRCNAPNKLKLAYRDGVVGEKEITTKVEATKGKKAKVVKTVKKAIRYRFEHVCPECGWKHEAVLRLM